MTNDTKQPKPITIPPADIARLARLDVGERTSLRIAIPDLPSDARMDGHCYCGCEATFCSESDGPIHPPKTSPFGAPGTRLWCKEVWAEGNPNHFWIDGKRHLQRTKPSNGKCFGILYKVSFGAALKPVCEGFTGWRSPVTMPQWASRIHLTTIECEAMQVDGVWLWCAVVERVEGATMGELMNNDGPPGAMSL